MNKQVSVFGCGRGNATCKCTCGTDAKPHVCEHRWDGAQETIEYYEGGAIAQSTTCSRCGMTALSHALWVGP
jgi:hypothetical protein